MSSFLRFKLCARNLLGLAKIYRNDFTSPYITNVNENRPTFLQPFRSLAGTNRTTTSNSIQHDGATKTGSNEILLSKAIEAKSIETAIPLFRELKLLSHPIAEEFFLPLISAQNDVESILRIIDIMRTEFSILMPSSSAIRLYIVPKLANYQTVDELMNLLKYRIGCKSNVAALSCTYHYLSVCQWDNALQIANSYDIFYSPKLFRNVLINAFYLTKELESFATFVHIIWNSIANVKKAGIFKIDDDQQDVLGDILYETVRKLNETQHQDLLKQMLIAIMSRGLGISLNQRTRIEKELGDNINDEITQILLLLSSGLLEPVQITKNTKSNLSNADENIKNLIEQSIEKSNKSATLRHFNSLLEIYYYKKDWQKFAELIEHMENDGHPVSNKYYTKLISTRLNDIDESVKMYRKIREQCFDFQLTYLYPLFIMVSNLLKHNRFDEAIQILIENRRNEIIDKESSTHKANEAACWGLLKLIASHGDANKVDRLFDVLIENNYALPSNRILGPLVTVHLNNNDLRKAVDAFERIATRYNVTPCRNPLMRQLIENDQVVDLQRIVDLSSKRHGDIKTLYSLACAFVEGGRKLLAKQVIERLGSHIDPKMFDNQFRYYLNKEQIDHLKAFFDITKPLAYFQRECLYNCLLDYYCKAKQNEMVLGLWQERIDEGLPLSLEFVTILAEFKVKHNIDVPFEIPQNEKEAFETMVSKVKQINAKWKVPSPSLPLVEKKNTTLEVTKPAWPLVEKCVQQNELDDACVIVNQLLINKNEVDSRIFSYVLGKLALRGQCDSLTSIGANMTSDQKKEFSFDNRLCVAHNKADRGLEFIEKLEEQIDNCQTNEEIKDIGKHFPFVSHCILEDHPELTEKYESMAQKYANNGIIEPLNVLWMYHFVEGNENVCQRIWQQYLSQRPVLLCKYIMMKARAQKNHQLVEKLISLTNESAISSAAKGVIYSGLIDIYSAKEMYDEALNTIRQAEKIIGINFIHKHCFDRVKIGLAATGKEYPF